jgi:hypothetical protein
MWNKLASNLSTLIQIDSKAFPLGCPREIISDAISKKAFVLFFAASKTSSFSEPSRKRQHKALNTSTLLIVQTMTSGQTKKP